MAKSATSPSITGHLLPVSLPPIARDRTWAASGLPVPSASARQPIAEPSASFGSRRRFWVSVPASSKASVAR